MKGVGSSLCCLSRHCLLITAMSIVWCRCFGFELDLWYFVCLFIWLANLILGYLISVRYLKRVLLDWLVILSLGMCCSIVRSVTVHWSKRIKNLGVLDLSFLILNVSHTNTCKALSKPFIYPFHNCVTSNVSSNK